MTTNADLTIFNSFADKATRSIVYVPHYIDEVWIYRERRTNPVDGGMKGSDNYKIRIPYEKCTNWMKPNDFRKLQIVNKEWTVQEGDFFIEGKWNGGNVKGIDEIKKASNSVVGKVLNHSENFCGISKHIRIGGGT